jgi:MtN3 and saliva related transmembrane protein
MNFIELLTTVFGVLMSIGHFPQAYTMFRNKSGNNVSLLTYSIFAVGCTIWLIYGIMSHEAPIIISYSLGTIGPWLVLGLRLHYGVAAKKP